MLRDHQAGLQLNCGPAVKSRKLSPRRQMIALLLFLILGPRALIHAENNSASLEPNAPQTEFQAQRRAPTLSDEYKRHVRVILDRVDAVRHLLAGQGNLDVPMPSIVVVGDQSSGKSSVLEAIASINLPRGTGMVTRVPIILQLRSEKNDSRITISYVPKKTSDPVEVQINSNAAQNLSEVIREAQKRITGSDYGASDTPITVRILGPEQPDLTLIDLPGLIRVRRNDQPTDIVDTIERLVYKYVSDPNAIILALAAGNNDLENSSGLKMASEVDPEGYRTLGILTKSDLCEPRELYRRVSEAYRLSVKTLGFIPVHCRSESELTSGMDFVASRQKEADFFEGLKLKIADFEGHSLGVDALVAKLGELQRRRVLEAMPEIRKKVAAALDETQARLDGLGPDISSDEEAREVLGRLLGSVKAGYGAVIEGRFSELAALRFISLDTRENVTEDKIDGKLMARFMNSSDSFVAALAKIVDTVNDRQFLDTIKATFNRTKGVHLDGFVPLDPFYEIWKESIFRELWRPIERFVLDIAVVVAEVGEALVSDIFRTHYGLLLPRMQEGLTQLVDKKTAETRVLLKSLLDAHYHPYGRRSFLASDKGDLEREKSLNKQGSSASTQAQATVELQERLSLYTRLVVSQLEDVVVRCLYTHLVMAVKEDVHRFLYDREFSRVRKPFGNSSEPEQVSTLLEDMRDPERAQERAQLQRKISALYLAASKLEIN